VKTLTVFLLSTGLAYGQAPGKIITFNKADTEHCKVVTVSGRPLLQSTYDGMTVAIAIPMNRGNGDFSIFVAVSQTGTQTVRVNPKDFYGLYSDQNHTRFTFYDKAAEMNAAVHTQGANGEMSAANAQVDPGSIRPGAMGPGGPPPGGWSTGCGYERTCPDRKPKHVRCVFTQGKSQTGVGNRRLDHVAEAERREAGGTSHRHAGRGRHTGEWSLVSLLMQLGLRIWPKIS
jgi:hypothetical protein